jgi:hypothetical protein
LADFRVSNGAAGALAHPMLAMPTSPKRSIEVFMG